MDAARGMDIVVDGIGVDSQALDVDLLFEGDMEADGGMSEPHRVVELERRVDQVGIAAEIVLDRRWEMVLEESWWAVDKDNSLPFQVVRSLD
jgi:hypothetical protein